MQISNLKMMESLRDINKSSHPAKAGYSNFGFYFLNSEIDERKRETWKL